MAATQITADMVTVEIAHHRYGGAYLGVYSARISCGERFLGRVRKDDEQDFFTAGAVDQDEMPERFETMAAAVAAIVAEVGR